MKKIEIDIKKYNKNISKKKCLILGDIILDQYIFGDVKRISQEAPVPIVEIKNKSWVLGGAANVAANLRGVNVESYLCGIIGNDFNGKKILSLLKKNNINFVGEIFEKRKTILKTRIIGCNQQMIRLDDEEIDTLTDNEEKIFLNKIKKIICEMSMVIIEDYNKAMCTTELCREIIDKCNSIGIPVLIDPSVSDWNKFRGATVITPNGNEVSSILGKFITNSNEDIEYAAHILKEKYSIKNILITRADKGMSLLSERKAFFTYSAVTHKVVDVSGAGDTVIAVLAAMILSGLLIEEATVIACYAAGIVVGKQGTAIVKIEELESYIRNNEDGKL